MLGNIVVDTGAVIDAGSVVTKRVDAFTRVRGVPAKLISHFTTSNKTTENVIIIKENLCNISEYRHVFNNDYIETYYVQS